MEPMTILYVLVGLVVGFGIGALVLHLTKKKTDTTDQISQQAIREAAEAAEAAEAEARQAAKKAIDDARSEADRIVKDARSDAREERSKAMASLEEEGRRLKVDAQKAEQRARQAEDALNKRKDAMSAKEIEMAKREAAIERSERSLSDRKRVLDEKMQQADVLVAQKAGLSKDEAKKELIESITDEAKREAALFVRETEETAKEEAESRAKRIVGIAIQRYAGEHVQERAVSVIHLPTDELKGRIIGREGRNIRTLEAATGIDLIVDDTPETVVISGFDPVRREVARLSIERLIQDGRIHPSRIEETVQKARDDVNKAIKDAGEQAILELGLARVDPEIVKMLGRLKFRYSYAQNVLRHSVECGFICGMMAAELGLNQRKARRAGLLHDIGKAMTHEVEGSHAVIGAQFAKKHGEEALVVNAIASHHEDEAPTSVIAHLVAAADALSGARPGARREMLESYVKRLEDLEGICRSFDGVSNSYAIQAGREVRVMVESDKVSDNDASMLSRDIAARIEKELTYPGQIKVTVIRESRAQAIAR
jgi:ribonuclease Y